MSEEEKEARKNNQPTGVAQRFISASPATPPSLQPQHQTLWLRGPEAELITLLHTVEDLLRSIL